VWTFGLTCFTYFQVVTPESGGGQNETVQLRRTLPSKESFLLISGDKSLVMSQSERSYISFYTKCTISLITSFSVIINKKNVYFKSKWNKQ